MNFFLLLNTKDILKNVSNQKVDGPINCLILYLHITYIFFKISSFVEQKKKLLQIVTIT